MQAMLGEKGREIPDAFPRRTTEAMTMTTLAWICAGLIAGSPAADTSPPASRAAAAYQEARAKAGRSPEEQVRLALWCEAHGLTNERLHHLALAVLADPGNVAARGLMGLVARDGRWSSPESVASKLLADPARVATLAEYEARRQKAAYTADGQWALGTWADEHGLSEQARAHLTAVIRLDPAREAAWHRLGYTKHDGRWATDAQLRAGKAEVEAQKAADRHWKPLLEKYKAMLGQPSKRGEAEEALAGVVDPRAVPMILQAFAAGRADDQRRATLLLGQIESPSSSRALAGLAVLAKSPEVRRVALETLKARDPRDFVGLWIALVRKPTRYEVRPVGGPGSPGTLIVEGQRANLRRVYTPAAMPNVPVLPGTRLDYDANGLPVLTEPIGQERLASMLYWLPVQANSRPQIAATLQQFAGAGPATPHHAAAHPAATAHPAAVAPTLSLVPYVMTDQGLMPYSGPVNNRLLVEKDLRVPIGEMMLEAQRSAQSSQQQLDLDVAALEKANAAVLRANEPTLQALRVVTGKDLGDDPEAWAKWWTENQGYAFHLTQTAEKPTVIEDVPTGYVPMTVPQVVNGPIIISHSCFAAGTTVRTIQGDRAIETIRAGDLVLAQDAKTGALGYRAVVTAYHNPPSPTLRVVLDGGDAVVATGIHRFWKAGKGWTMARDLTTGDLVRTLGGVARVSAVEPERVQPVFNLELADGQGFLVGKLGALVHDNSPVEATPAPFDAGAVAAK